MLDVQNISSAAFVSQSEQAARFLKCLANPHRLLLLCQLIDGEKSVSQLEAASQLSQSSASQHLARLRDEGIVQTRRDHRHVYYALKDGAAMEVMGVLYRYYSQNTNE